jgi:CubicO group peptidase (beta-lactamase class C family)
VLDMRSGVAFTEDYADPDSDLRRLGRGLYEQLRGLRVEAPHGSRFLYRSAETDVLGWVCERAGGAPMAELMSSLVWAPLGAEHDAVLLCDPAGTAVHDGGLAVTARDLLRFGLMLLDGGAPVLPPQWLRRAWAVDSGTRQAFLDSPAEQVFPGGWYRNQFWFRPGAYGDVLLALGIHGQMLHVSRRTRTVGVKLSSWPEPQQPVHLQDTLRAFDAIGGALSRLPRRRASVI